LFLQANRVTGIFQPFAAITTPFAPIPKTKTIHHSGDGAMHTITNMTPKPIQIGYWFIVEISLLKDFTNCFKRGAIGL
jgi:hypothetical protein